MADSKLLVPELSEAEAMGAEKARLEELLLQVRTDRTPGPGASKELQQAQTRPESKQIQPQPGFCIKTNSSEGKVFINICHSPSIPPPADVTEDELLQMLEEDQAGFRIPMSLGEPHAELDASQCPQRTQEASPLVLFSPGSKNPGPKASPSRPRHVATLILSFSPGHLAPSAWGSPEGQGCTAYDVAVNSDFYRRMQNSDFFREFVITIAREGLEDKYSLQLNPEWRMLKNRPFMGSISQQNIRSQQRPRIQELGSPYAPASQSLEEGPEKPHLSLWLETPDLLLAEIGLPKLNGALGLSLEIGEHRLVVGGPQQLYHLDAYIPLRINSDESKAAFHRKRKVMWGAATDGGHAPSGGAFVTCVPLGF
ncbi:PIH1 domain-containing protein 1 [Galemys pyrenaicus]|uniref:PIH1 domain-containing protein 1 n=1 Tax=Galemys pyrenaicus TaxID=202257 RepID=A0A8J6DUT0_GALPY|nr:PIH1 domain-containing protein 1 [Galemys pyrenaicus]